MEKGKEGVGMNGLTCMMHGFAMVISSIIGPALAKALGLHKATIYAAEILNAIACLFFLSGILFLLWGFNKLLKEGLEPRKKVST